MTAKQKGADAVIRQKGVFHRESKKTKFFIVIHLQASQIKRSRILLSASLFIFVAILYSRFILMSETTSCLFLKVLQYNQDMLFLHRLKFLLDIFCILFLLCQLPARA